jgi:serine/threonine protein kinase
MEGQFNKIKKFKGVLLALMVAVTASIPVTTGEFKDVYAEMVVPKNQKYKRHYGYRDKEGYFFVSKGNDYPTVLRYTLKVANNQVVCSFEVYTEVTVTKGNQQNRSYRCWLSLGNLKLRQQDIACASGVAACWHPNDETINKAYGMIGNLNAVYQDAHGRGLNFKAVGVSQGESVYAQDGYAVNEHFINYLLRQNSDRSRLCGRVQPVANYNHQQQLAANPNQGNQSRQPAANLGQPNQVPGYQQCRFNQNQQPRFNQFRQPAQQFNQFRQPAQPYGPSSIQRFLSGIKISSQKIDKVGALFTRLPSKKSGGYSYYLTDIRGSGSFGTVYGAILVDSNGNPIVCDGKVAKYCIKIMENTHIKVRDDGSVFSSVRDWQREQIAEGINKEIFMMRKMAGCWGTSQFIETFNQKMQGGTPINVCIVQSDCGYFTLKDLAGKSTDFENMAHIMGQILLAAKNIHKQHIAHRDIKSENVAIGGNGLVSFIDFGVARVIDKGDNNNALGRTGVGTPFYMAPEVLCSRGHCKRADIWSIGCLFYELLAENKPFLAKNLSELYALSLQGPNWQKFAAHVQRNFRVNGMPINESQMRVIGNFVSQFLNPNQYERLGMTNCIDNFIHMCSVLNINLESSLMNSLRNARSANPRARH